MAAQVVAFDYAGWQLAYPEFAYIKAPQAQGYFNLACNFCDNTGAGPITDTTVGGTLYTLLLLATSHVAALFANQANGQAPSPIVGRIESASEGAVSFSAKFIDAKNPTEAFFQQTKYGALFWAMTSVYRTAQYVPPPCYPFGSPALAPFPYLGARNW